MLNSARVSPLCVWIAQTPDYAIIATQKAVQPRTLSLSACVHNERQGEGVRAGSPQRVCFALIFNKGAIKSRLPGVAFI